MEKETETVHITSPRITFTSMAAGVASGVAIGKYTNFKNDVTESYEGCAKTALSIQKRPDDVCPPYPSAFYAIDTAINLGAAFLVGVVAAKVSANLMGERATIITTREKPSPKTAIAPAIHGTTSGGPAPQA